MLAESQSKTNAPSDASALRRFSHTVNDALVRPKRWQFNLTLLLLAAVGYSFLCFHVFHGVPRIDDSVAALFQARLFALGHAIWPMPAEVQPWFDIFGVIPPMDKPDYWTGMYTPGWSMLLAIGVLFGVPWLVNPVLGGLLCIVISEIATDRYGKLTGRVAGILAVFSPYIGVVSASYLSHTSAALFVALAWWSTARLLSTQRGLWACIAGASIGFALLIRSEAALLVGIIIAIGTLVQFRAALAVWKWLIVAAGIALVFVAMLLAWQDYAVGKAGSFGHRIDMGGSADFGFGRVGDSNYHYTPAKARMHSEQRLQAIHERILGWPIPALVLLLAPFLLARPKWHGLWLVVPLIVLTGFFYYYWYFEEWLPGRYFFPAVPFLIVLMAQGWHIWQQRIARVSVLSALPAVLLIVGSLFAVTVSAPRYHTFFKAHHGDVEDWLIRYLDHYQLDNALILYRSLGKLHYGMWNDFYATAFMFNDLELKGNVIIARDNAHRNQGRTTLDNAELFAMFPDRNYYYYTFNQSNGRSIMYRLTVENNEITHKERLRDPLFARIRAPKSKKPDKS